MSCLPSSCLSSKMKRTESNEEITTLDGFFKGK